MDRVESLMPKGVEHMWLKLSMSTWLIRVESLMPKGVEHYLRIALEESFWDVLNLWCRKALSTMKAIKLGSAKTVLNLWCRKALSTINPNWLRANPKSVESLMPKGVEHPRRRAARGVQTLCWISDAERRWALSLAIARPKGTVVLNLWCRKALSTKQQRILDSQRVVLNLWCRKALSTILWAPPMAQS